MIKSDRVFPIKGYEGHFLLPFGGDVDVHRIGDCIAPRTVEIAIGEPALVANRI